MVINSIITEYADMSLGSCFLRGQMPHDLTRVKYKEELTEAEWNGGSQWLMGEGDGGRREVSQRLWVSVKQRNMF